MLDPRVYRAGLLPALLALIVAAFSIQPPPVALTATLPPDSFSGVRAFGTLQTLARQFPSRRPGSQGDDGLAARMRADLIAAGFRVGEHRFTARTADGTRELRNVIGTRAGFTQRRIVVVAHRDALERGATAQLSATAGLLELARVFGGRTLNKTLVLASTSGGSAGAAGAAELAGTLDGADAVIVLGDLAGKQLRRPMVVPWSNAEGIAPLLLRRTVEAALRLEGGVPPGTVGAFAQFARQAFPFTTGEQGQFLAKDEPSVLVSATGERGPGAERATSSGRMTDLGRAVLRSITALDARPKSAPRPRAEILVAGKILPGWALRLLVGALILPVLMAAVDGAARVRRRRHPVGMWTAWTVSAALPFAGALLVAFILRWTGLMASPPPGPAPPGSVPVDGAAVAVLAGLALALVAAWVAVRPLVLRVWGVRGDPGSPGAAAAVLLVLVGVVTAIWVANPFAAALLLVLLHACLVVTAPEVRVRRSAGLAIVAVALLPVAAVALYYAFALDYGPLELVWTALLLAAGGGLGLPALAAWCLLLGTLACLVSVIRAHRSLGGPEKPDGGPPIRGPVTYAGPGSLGGTESALRR